MKPAYPSNHESLAELLKVNALLPWLTFSESILNGLCGRCLVLLRGLLLFLLSELYGKR